METSQLNQLGSVYSNALEKQDLSLYLEHLSLDAIQWWFNLDIHRIAMHFAPLQDQGNVHVEMPLRLAFIAELMNGEISLERIVEYYDLFRDDDDYDSAALAVGAGFQQILDNGVDFSIFSPWQQLAEELLQEDIEVSPLARASLLGLMGHTAIAAEGNPLLAERLFSRQLREIEKSGSISLKVYHAAFRAYVFYFNGDLSSAKIFLQDVLPFSNSADCSLISRLYFQATYAFYHIYSGDYQGALQILDKTVSHPVFDKLPPTLWLFAQSHRLLAFAYLGDHEQTEKLALHIRSWSVPIYNTFYHSYLHYSLGVMALINKEHRTAYLHAEETFLLGEKSHSLFSQLMAALLKTQCLADMGRTKEALTMIDEWLPFWEKKGFSIVASTGVLEMANILASQRRIAESREYFQRAKNYLPEKEPLHPLHRSECFLQQLKQRLFSIEEQKAQRWEQYPVRIKTLGGFRVEIGDNVVYDRQWRGERTKLLLKLLIVNGGHKVSIGNLADLLWPDADGDKARQNIKITLWRLRRVGLKQKEAPLPWLQLEAGQLSLVRSLCIVDAIIFEKEVTGLLKNSNVNINNLSQALELYQGDFLTGDVSETQIIQYREYLEKLYVNGVIRLAEIVDSHEWIEYSLNFLIQARDMDPLNEIIHERIMMFYFKLGFPAKALQSYQYAEKILMQELGIHPAPFLVSLANSIKDKSHS